MYLFAAFFFSCFYFFGFSVKQVEVFSAAQNRLPSPV